MTSPPVDRPVPAPTGPQAPPAPPPAPAPLPADAPDRAPAAPAGAPAAPAGSSARAGAVVLAGGSGTRVGAGMNKVYLEVAGRPVLSWSLRHAWLSGAFDRIVLVVRAGDEDLAAHAVAAAEVPVPVRTVHGGTSRHASERCGLAALADDVAAGLLDVVAVHDGARPLALPDLWARTVATARAHGGAVPGYPATRLRPAAGTADRTGRAPQHTSLVRVQTPQAFRAVELLAAYAEADRHGFTGTDTAACAAAHSGLDVRVVPDGPENLKVTFARDLVVVARLLADLTAAGPTHRAGSVAPVTA